MVTLSVMLLYFQKKKNVSFKRSRFEADTPPRPYTHFVLV